ncbi:MAG: ribosome biogenesis GTPase YlqF [Planctomycetota bacterium]|jgi:ribosome biogenesis GTPase A
MIQWYPGHMHKAKKEFQKILPQADLVIEVLDARIPFSSQNPLLAQLRKDKPCIKLLNKSDLADKAVVSTWQARLERDSSVKTLVCHHGDVLTRKLPLLCRSMIPQRDNRSSMIYALIAGVPNVGKSTLINKLAGRNVAKTGNEAALTRMQQRIEINPDLMLIDTPGMLWPKIENENSGYRLAATGAIRDTAIDLQEVASFVAEFLLADYPGIVQHRYALQTLPDSDIALLEAIAKKRGCIVSGGKVDYEKVSRLLISELRNGELGGICLETPEMLDQELAALEIIRTRKLEELAAKKSARLAKKN